MKSGSFFIYSFFIQLSIRMPGGTLSPNKNQNNQNDNRYQVVTGRGMPAGFGSCLLLHLCRFGHFRFLADRKSCGILPFRLNLLRQSTPYKLQGILAFGTIGDGKSDLLPLQHRFRIQ